MLPLLALGSLGRHARTPVALPLPGHVVDVIAGDFYLQAPDTIPAGPTTFRVRVRQGDHFAMLLRLDPGHTAGDLLRARQEGHARPSWAHFVGGPGFPARNGTANATMVLAPGEYLLMCDVTAHDGVRHIEKGMYHPLVVRGEGNASLPRADAVVRMRDHVFAFSGPIRAGPRALRVVNEGSVMHEFRLVHVLPGHTGKESLAWKPGDKTPRPDEDVMALVGIVPGGELMTTIEFTAGEYVVLCVPEIDHGMIRVVRVDN